MGELHKPKKSKNQKKIKIKTLFFVIDAKQNRLKKDQSQIKQPQMKFTGA